MVNGKPRLRIFANQQLNEVDKETDFIDPQPYVGQDQNLPVYIILTPEARSPLQALWNSR